MKQKSDIILGKIIKYSFIIMLVGIILVMIILDKNVGYVTEEISRRISNRILWINAIMIVAVGILGIHVLARRKWKINERQYWILTAISVAIGVVLQIYLFKNLYFRVSWDVERVVNAAAYMNGDKVHPNWILRDNVKSVREYLNGYFSRYPNNIAITIILSYLQKIVKICGVKDYYIGGIVGGIACVEISGILSSAIVRKITKNNRAALLTWCFFFALIGMSPWIIIPYTDIYAMPFVTGSVYSYLCLKDKGGSFVMTAILGAFQFIGYQIKPTVLIVGIAIVLIEGWKIVFAFDRSKIKKTTEMILVVFAVACVCSAMGKYEKKTIESTFGKLNNEAAFSMTHFAMMGLSREGGGGYYGNDVIYSSGFQTKKERANGNIKVIEERLSEYGISGVIVHEIKKLLMIYDDGTFAWGSDGGRQYRVKAPTDITSYLGKKIQQYYLPEGKYYSIFVSVQQSIWLMCLLMMLGNISGKNKDSINLLELSVIGITMFLLIFEARARYIICYMPLYVCLAVNGGINIYTHLTKNKRII